jgi:ribose/xylose/arabinose/galactoside ABC-type transport system permease subunit
MELKSELKTARRFTKFLVVLALLFIALGIHNIASPNAESSLKRGNILFRLATELLGANGPAYLCFAVAAFCAYFARFVWRRTAKKPNDAWL